LVEAARSSGTDVRFGLSGLVAPLSPGVDLAAYRIVQEALTNARRHAPGATVDVGLRYEPMLLRIRVQDDGPGPAPNASGHGLQGMRERAAMVGGTLRTGPTDGGGFLVQAELPTGERGDQDAT
jgi:signal transduction histidine kinase